MLVMQSIARFEAGGEGHRWRAQTWLWCGLPDEKILFRGVNRDVTTRGLTSAAYIVGHIELSSAMFGVAAGASDHLPLVDSTSFLIHMTRLAIAVRDARET